MLKAKWIPLWTLLVAAASIAAEGQPVTVILGRPRAEVVEGTLARELPLGNVYSLAVMPDGGYVIGDDMGELLRVAPDGSVSYLANAVSTRGAAVLPDGTIFFSDAFNSRIWKRHTNGTLEVQAGAGGYTLRDTEGHGDGGDAREARLASPRGIAFGSDGSLYFAEAFSGRIRRVAPDRIISTVAVRKDGTITATPFRQPEGLAMDEGGNLFVSEYAGHRVWRIARDGNATVAAGTGEAGLSGDGGPAVEARLNSPSGIWVDKQGNLYIADTRNGRVRQVTPDGRIATVAGENACASGAPAVETCLLPASVAVDGEGRLLVTDYQNRLLRRVDGDGTLRTVTGTITTAQNGDRGPASGAMFFGGAVAVTGKGEIFVSDDCRYSFVNFGGPCIRKISPDGKIDTLPESKELGSIYAGKLAVDSGGSLVLVGFGRLLQLLPGGGTEGVYLKEAVNVSDFTFGPDGRLYAADYLNHRVVRIAADGSVQTLAGNGKDALSGEDGSPAREAAIGQPHSIAVDSAGNIYVSHRDPFWTVVRVIRPDGSIERFIGDRVAAGTDGSENEGVLARNASLPYYCQVNVDPRDRVYLGCGFDRVFRIYRVEKDGTLRTVVVGPSGDPGDPGEKPPFRVGLDLNLRMAFDAEGNLYISDRGRLTRISVGGLDAVQ